MRKSRDTGYRCPEKYTASAFVSCLCLVFCVLASSSGAAADFSLHGFVQGNYSVNTTADNPDGTDFKWSEERIQGKLEASQDAFRLYLKEDAFYDNLNRKASTELREGYADYAGGAWDVRTGRHIITWGLGDLLFINDVFPKDYNAFFSGRPMEYMKKGVDGVKIGAYPGFVSLEFVAIPFFEPNTHPDPQRFRMYDPLSGITSRAEQEPASTWENVERALRLYCQAAEYDVSLYFYRGYFRQPSGIPDDPAAPTSLRFIYPKLSVYGASAQGRAWDGVISLEAGYYDSRDDRSGNNPLIPNSQSRYLVGYQRQFWEDFTLGFQYYAEYLHDYSAYELNLASSVARAKRLHQLATVRLSQLLMNQTLRMSFFAFYGLSDNDYLLIPEVQYNVTDSVWLELGAHLFGGGEAWSQFGQFAQDDNIFAQARYEF
jgi:hypothetical protein